MSESQITQIGTKTFLLIDKLPLQILEFLPFMGTVFFSLHHYYFTYFILSISTNRSLQESNDSNSLKWSDKEYLLGEREEKEKGCHRVVTVSPDKESVVLTLCPLISYQYCFDTHL